MVRRVMIAFVLALTIAACGPSAPPAAPVGSRGGGAACVEGLLGQVAAESVAVAAAPDGVYWLDYNVGSLHRGGRDGRVTTLAKPGEEQNSEELIVDGGYLYWDSKATRSIHRMKLAGGTPETIIRVPGEDFPVGLAVAGDIVYTRTYEGELMWWNDGEVGQRSLEISAMATRGTSLYLGNSTGIGQLADDPDGEVWDITMNTDPVESIAVSGDTLFWVEREGEVAVLLRRALAGGEIEAFSASADGSVNLAGIALGAPVPAAPGGAYLPVADTVLYAPASGPPVVRVVARAPGEIIDLAVDGDALIAATADGRVYRLCVDAAP
jgi:hypothetical protein